jgi:ABC-type transporter Mla subunit MlaD
MTELERMLKDALARMEQEMTSTLQAHGTALDEQRQQLAVQEKALAQQQGQMQRMNNDLQVLTWRLQESGDASASLEPLLSRLNAILNGR